MVDNSRVAERRERGEGCQDTFRFGSFHWCLETQFLQTLWSGSRNSKYWCFINCTTVISRPWCWNAGVGGVERGRRWGRQQVSPSGSRPPRGRPLGLLGPGDLQMPFDCLKSWLDEIALEFLSTGADWVEHWWRSWEEPESGGDNFDLILTIYCAQQKVR